MKKSMSEDFRANVLKCCKLASNEANVLPLDLTRHSRERKAGRAVETDTTRQLWVEGCSREQLGAECKNSEHKSKADKDVVQLNYKENQKQCELNAEVDSILKYRGRESAKRILSRVKKLAADVTRCLFVKE